MSGWLLLSRAQKWDLVRMGGAAVLSTVFLGLPLALSQPDTRTTFAADAAAATEQHVVVVAQDLAAPVATPELSPVRPLLRRSRSRSAPRPQPTASAPSRNTSFRGRLARVFAGDGRYSVRPFPTVGTGDH
jgi:hypothetical protein